MSEFLKTNTFSELNDSELLSVEGGNVVTGLLSVAAGIGGFVAVVAICSNPITLGVAIAAVGCLTTSAFTLAGGLSDLLINKPVGYPEVVSSVSNCF